MRSSSPQGLATRQLVTAPLAATAPGPFRASPRVDVPRHVGLPRRVAAAAALLLVLGSAAAAPAAAAPRGLEVGANGETGSVRVTGGEASWSIRPADGEHGDSRDNFRLEARPGERIQDALVVTNRGSAPLTLRVYGADGELRDGFVDLAATEAASVGIGAWLDAASDLRLAAGESAEVPFTLDVPASTEPGSFAGGIVTSSLAAGDGGVAVDRRLAASVVVTVLAPGGPAPSSDRAPSSIGAASPPVGALLALGGLLVVAAAVWVVVLRGRANT